LAQAFASGPKLGELADMMGSPGGGLSMMENPQAEDGEETPGATSWGGAWAEQEAVESGMSSMHAMNATTAAYHADVAAKHAASLAQWVQYLWGTLNQLQNKVTELEDWKKKALDDVRKLRDEHKMLRRKVLGDERPDEPQTPGAALPLRSKSVPLSIGAMHASEPGTPATRPPPGLGFASEGAEQEEASPSDSVSLPATSSAGNLSPNTPSSSPLGDADGNGGHLEGVRVSSASTADGISCERAEWRIGHLSTKLRGCMGRPLVSSPFSVAGLEDLRLMVNSDGKDVPKGPRNRRQKELYAKKVTEGPLEGCLKLKVPSCPEATQLVFYLQVGSQRRGPFEHNFAESTVSGCDDFGIDWLTQVDADQSLTVSVEILQAPTVSVASQ